MTLLYNIGIQLYYLLILAASAFNPKAKFWINGRRQTFGILKQKLPVGGKRAWFHCASLGEFEQARPVIESFNQSYPDYTIVLTFFSPSGYEIRKNYSFAHCICYLPLDTKANAKRFVEMVNPDIVFFVKYEFWYHFLHTLHKKNIPTILFSAIFRQNQAFFKSYNGWYRSVLSYFSHIFVQNSESKVLLNQINIKNVAESGDTRFDRVFQIATAAKLFPEVEAFKAGKKILIAGSTWHPDEALLKNYINKNTHGIKFVIAPHEIHRSNIEQLISSIERKTVRFSQIQQANLAEAEVLIIDNIGILSSLYQYGDIAYIGGGFGVGIHNILEAATFGLPIVFGTNYQKFQEAKDLIKEGSAFAVKDENELNLILNKLLTNNDLLNSCGKISKEYVWRKKGATQQILTYLANSILKTN